jgi:hypothetical protein
MKSYAQSAIFMPELSTGFQSYIRVKMWITCTSGVHNYFAWDSIGKQKNALKRL